MKKWETVHTHKGYEIIILNGAELSDCFDYQIKPHLFIHGTPYSNISDAVKAIDKYLK